MKKYGLTALLFLSCISHAVSESTIDVDEYYKNALEKTEELNAAKSETAEVVYSSAAEKKKKIAEISKKIDKLKSNPKTKSEELKSLQLELSSIQAELQADTLKMSALSLIQAKDAKSAEEMHEEKAQKEHQELADKLKEKLDNSDFKL